MAAERERTQYGNSDLQEGKRAPQTLHMWTSVKYYIFLYTLLS